MIDRTQFVEMTRRLLLCLAPAALVACSAPPGTTGNTASGTAPSGSTSTSHGETTAPSLAEAERGLIEGQARGEWLPDEAARLAAEKEKQDYLDHHVDKSTIQHSFHARTGEYWDCVDRNMQPGMKPGYVIATPPPPLPTPVFPANTLPAVQSVLVHASEIDEEGNVMHCPEGTVPYKRVTPETLARFPTLDSFVHWKSYKHLSTPAHSKNKLHPDSVMHPDTVLGYGNATAFQDVSNLGIQSTINLWNFSTEYSDDLSLSQTWTSYNVDEETAEVGAVALEDVFGTWDAVLFLYYTNTSYHNGNAGYDSGYAVYDSSIYVGAGWANYSVFEGTQYAIAFETYIYGGNIWLAYNGTWFAYFYG